MKVKMALKTSQLAVKMALRGAKMAISGVLKYARALCTKHRFFRLRCKKVMLKTSCGEIKKNCVLSVFCA